MNRRRNLSDQIIPTPTSDKGWAIVNVEDPKWHKMTGIQDMAECGVVCTGLQYELPLDNNMCERCAELLSRHRKPFNPEMVVIAD